MAPPKQSAQPYFSPACRQAADRPAVYVVDGFYVSQTASPSQAGPPASATPPAKATKLAVSAYPPESKRAFDATMEASLKLIQFRLQATPPLPPGDARFERLFSLRQIPDVSAFPQYPGSGDVLLVPCYLPELYKIAINIDDSEFTNADASATTFNRMFSNIGLTIETAFVNRWKALSAPTKPPPTFTDAPRLSDAIGIGGGLVSTYNFTGRSGPTIKVYFSQRLGVVDVGYPALHATSVFSQKKRPEILRTLEHDTTTPFGPAAVAAAATKLKDPDRIKFLEAVGRGLAYNMLHEFCHAATMAPGHPLANDPTSGSGLWIENKPRGTIENLTLQPATLVAIGTAYQDTWCKFLSGGVKNIGRLPG